MSRSLAVGMAMVCVAEIAAADDKPAPPPSVAAIKACIKQMDVAGRWRFEWKTVEIGAPRHPQNNYEGHRSDYGYPVHVVYTLVGLTDIDNVYWLIRDAGGHWQIPAVCMIK